MKLIAKEIVGRFLEDVNYVDVFPIGDGHINDTYMVKYPNKKYVLQRINHHVFKKPRDVMSNILSITEHIKEKLIANGGDPKRGTINIIKTLDNDSLVETKEGNYYRMYEYIDGVRTYETVENPVHFYNAAKTFGKFQMLLSDFPAHKLHETIKDFHNTKLRVEAFNQAILNDPLNRKSEIQKEIDFVLERAHEASIIIDLMNNKKIPTRVTHNDTKYNNVMIDEKTGEGICVIDLDTVMPGSMLFDYGDSLRFGANTGLEDDQNLDNVSINVDLYEYFTKGFIEEMGVTLTEKEKDLMPFSVKLITYELGIRFLTDYLNGDVYFKIHRDKHNLERARAQFKLVTDIENKMDILKDIVDKYYYAK